MIPYLESFLEMHERNELPTWELVGYVVKFVAIEGAQSDYAEVPEWLRKEIERKLQAYLETKYWSVFSNLGEEDYGKYADIFLSKIGTKK